MSHNYEVLPVEVRKADLTDSQKKLLNVFFTLNTLEETKKNGYFFKTNADLIKLANITKPTLSSAISLFITYNFIETKRGKRTKEETNASTYVLKVDNIIEWCKANQKLNKDKKTKGKMGKINNDFTYLTQIDNILEELRNIRQENKELKEKLIEIQDGLNGLNKMGKIENHFTTDIDIETEIELDSNTYKCSSTRMNNNIKEKINNISSSNILKKENVEVDNSLSGYADIYESVEEEINDSSMNNPSHEESECLNVDKSSKEDMTSTQTNVEIRNLMTKTEKEDKNKTILQGDFSQRECESNEENNKSNIQGVTLTPDIPRNPLSQTTEDINKINSNDMTLIEYYTNPNPDKSYIFSDQTVKDLTNALNLTSYCNDKKLELMRNYVMNTETLESKKRMVIEKYETELKGSSDTMSDEEAINKMEKVIEIAICKFKQSGKDFAFDYLEKAEDKLRNKYGWHNEEILQEFYDKFNVEAKAIMQGNKSNNPIKPLEAPQSEENPSDIQIITIENKTCQVASMSVTEGI